MLKSFHYKYNQLKCLKPDSGHHVFTGYDRSTNQTDKSADLSEFADYRYYRSDKPLYRIGIGSADYKGPYRLIGMGIKRAHIGANLVKFEPLKYI